VYPDFGPLADELLGAGKLPVEIVTMASAQTKLVVRQASVIPSGVK